MPTLKLFPVPNTYQDKPLEIWTTKPHGQAWSEITAWASDQFDCSEHTVDTHEVFFGGKYGDDNVREVLTIRGEIVGVFDHPCTDAEWAAIFHAECFGDRDPVNGSVNLNRAA